MNDDKKVINRIFYDLKKFNVPNNKLTLVIIKFSIEEYEKIKRSYTLSKTTVYVLHLINSFGKHHNIKDKVKIDRVNDTLQMVEKDTCGMFQIYFYVNLFHQENN